MSETICSDSNSDHVGDFMTYVIQEAEEHVEYILGEDGQEYVCVSESELKNDNDIEENPEIVNMSTEFIDEEEIEEENEKEPIEAEESYEQMTIKFEEDEDESYGEPRITWMGKNTEQNNCFHCGRCDMFFKSIPDHLKEWHSRDDNVKPSTESDCDGEEATEHVYEEVASEREEIVKEEEEEIEEYAQQEETVEQDVSSHQRFICSDCNTLFTTLGHAKSHQCTATSETTKDKIANSKSIEEEKPIFPCAYCPSKFKTIISLRKHDLNCKVKQTGDPSQYRPKSKHHLPPPPSRFQCIECEAMFTSIKALTLHRRIHVVTEQAICKICNTTFSSLKNLKLHAKMHNKVHSRTLKEAMPLGADLSTEDEKLFYCEICSKSFDQKLLTVHRNMHQNFEEYSCGICNKQFENMPSYEMHMKLHADKPSVNKPQKQLSAERIGKRLPFPCQYCGREFLRPHEKVKHERIHTGEKPYECEVCGKTFRVTYSLTLHLRTHTNVRPYVCATCNKRFKSYPVYAHHLKTHSEDRPYQCPYCPKTFRTAVQLCGHKNSHKKPFNCPDCNRPFATMYAVKTHMKTHNKANKSNENLKHRCAICGAVYARIFALRFHMKDQHQKDLDCIEETEMNGIVSDEDEHATAAALIAAQSRDEQFNESETILGSEEIIIDQYETEEIVTDWMGK